MVGIMSMTAVHMQGHGASLSIIGFTISLHVAGMYALSPLFGILTDRVGRGVTIGAGFTMLAASALLLTLWPEPQWSVITSLVLLGLGWNSAWWVLQPCLTTPPPPITAPTPRDVPT